MEDRMKKSAEKISALFINAILPVTDRFRKLSLTK